MKPFDCGRQSPPPPASLASLGRGFSDAGYVPSNNACGLKVKIPPLDARKYHGGGLDWDAWAALGGVAAFIVLLALRRAGGGGGEGAGAAAPAPAQPQRRGGRGGAARGGGAQQPLLSA
jgi:hypothetical protein